MFGGEVEQGPGGTFEIYRAEGDNLFKNGEYKKAIESYSTALEIQRGDKGCLVARSRCHLLNGDTDAALKDAEASLKEDPSFPRGLYQKAEALYSISEFEMALMFYHRGHKLRPELQQFRLGIQKAQEAIDNSVGCPEKVRLTLDGDLSYFKKQSEKKPSKRRRAPAKKVIQPKQRVPPPSDSVHNPKTVKQLLGELYGDKVYLEKLLKATDPSSKTGSEIYDLACSGLYYLNNRAEFWMQQKPMYARKHEQKQKQRKPVSGEEKVTPKYVIEQLKLVENEQSKGRYAASLKRAKRCLQEVKKTAETNSNRNQQMSDLHNYIGLAYVELGEPGKALKHHQCELDIAEARGSQEAVSRALDNLGRVYIGQRAYDHAIEVWTRRLAICDSAIEKTWLSHEIGRCYLEVGDFNEAKKFGQQSVQSAKEAEDESWEMNATVLLAQCDIKLNNLHEAAESLDVARNIARDLGDTGAQRALRKARQDVMIRIEKEVPAPESENTTAEEEQ